MNPDRTGLTPPLKPRWRPRFSLRTLMIGVLLIASSWAATAIWGVPAIESKIENDLKLNGYNFCPLHGDEPGVNQYNYSTKYIAIAPFLVRVHLNAQGHVSNLYSIYFWIPGWKKELTNNFVVAVE